MKVFDTRLLTDFLFTAPVLACEVLVTLKQSTNEHDMNYAMRQP